MKMKRSIIIVILFAVMLVLGSYSAALADGGAEGGPCPDTLPSPTSGPFIRGDFTVAFDKKMQCIETTGCPHYNFHAVLKLGNETHLFSAPQTFHPDTTLCSFSPEQIKGLVERYPCFMDVAGAFGLLGTPVIADLNITLCDTFNDPQNGMILGEVVIRVVPPPKK
jgi:hypothetical protein